jgi:hypothetical protein
LVWKGISRSLRLGFRERYYYKKPGRVEKTVLTSSLKRASVTVLKPSHFFFLHIEESHFQFGVSSSKLSTFTLATPYNAQRFRAAQ